MSAAIRDPGSVLRAFAAFTMRDPGNVLRTAVRIMMRDADNVLREVFASVAGAGATAAPPVVRAYANSSTVVTATSAQVTATPAGGVAPYTYAWIRTDADAQPWTIDDPTAATTSFSTDLDSGDLFVAKFKCTITDATGATVDTNEVTVTARNMGGGISLL